MPLTMFIIALSGTCLMKMIKEHYNTISENLDYKVTPTKELLSSIYYGFKMFGKHDYLEAISGLMKEYYP
jgi:hypothetical protein